MSVTKNSKSIKVNFGIMSTGFKKTSEIIFDLKTAKLLQKYLKNKWSVHWKTREAIQQTLSDHIEACSK